MAKTAIEVANACPELRQAWQLLESAVAYRSYSDMFLALIDTMLARQSVVIATDNDIPYEPAPLPPNNFDKEEQNALYQAIRLIEEQYHQRIWDNNGKHTHQWYDPIGELYMICASRGAKSMLGQYFTPKHVVDLITQLSVGKSEKEIVTVNDPACGSGRMLLANAAYQYQQQQAFYAVAGDLDRICAKMTAINMTYNGCVGEVYCMDGLDITGESYRFGYQIRPVLSFFPKSEWNAIRFHMYRTTRKWAEQQYVAVPLAYENSFIKRSNEHQQQLGRQRKEQAKKKKWEGTLFQNSTQQLASTTPSKKRAKKKVVRSEGSSTQGTLF